MKLDNNGDGYLYTAYSSISGKGLFSFANILAGTILFKLKGEIISHPYTPAFAKSGSNWIGIGYQEWIATDAEDNAAYINHSCSANVIFNEHQELTALKDIAKGEELVLDYSTTELDPYWEMDCNCHHPNCRKIIRGFQFIPEDLQQQYKKYLPKAFWEAKNATIPANGVD